LRLLIRHWDPRLLLHAVALQNALIVRLLASDPLASDWLMGVSWQFALADEDACPPLPHPGSWTANTYPVWRAPEGGREEVPGGSGDVIIGPVQTVPDSATTTDPQVSADVKSDLERLFAARDAELELNAQRLHATDAKQPSFVKTEPLFLKTEPMDLDKHQSPGRDPSIPRGPESQDL